MTVTASKKPPWVPVIYGYRCFGFIFSRGRDGFEAFNIDERSLGVFTDEHAAVAAIFNPANNGKSR